MSHFQERYFQDEAPLGSIYQRAVNALMTMSRSGFTTESKLDDGNHGFSITVEDEDKPLAHLMLSAAQIAEESNPPIPMKSVFDESSNTLQFLFDGALEKPPVRALRDNLDKAKTYLLDQCVVKDTQGPGYYICNPHKLPMDPVELAISFVEPGEQHYCLYRLPPNVVFTDKHGQTHDSALLVNDEVMSEWLAKFRPDLTLDRVLASEVLIEPKTMARIVEQLGLGLEKGRQVC